MEHERRIDIGELNAAVKCLAASVERLTTSVDELSAKVDELMGDKQQLQGAIRMLKIVIAGCAGAAAVFGWLSQEFINLMHR